MAEGPDTEHFAGRLRQIRSMQRSLGAGTNIVVTKLREKYLDDANKEADWSARFGPNHLAAVNLRNL